MCEIRFLAHHCIRPPVLQAVVAIATEDVQPLTRPDVPVTLLFDLLEDPRLDEGTPETTNQGQQSVEVTWCYTQDHIPRYHTACNSILTTECVVIFIRQNITIS